MMEGIKSSVRPKVYTSLLVLASLILEAGIISSEGQMNLIISAQNCTFIMHIYTCGICKGYFDELPEE